MLALRFHVWRLPVGGLSLCLWPAGCQKIKFLVESTWIQPCFQRRSCTIQVHLFHVDIGVAGAKTVSWHGQWLSRKKEHGKQKPHSGCLSARKAAWAFLGPSHTSNQAAFSSLLRRLLPSIAHVSVSSIWPTYIPASGAAVYGDT